jgi:hypothetical protein
MIKKLLLSASVILMALVSNAQFKKGSILLGGDVGFGKQNSTDVNFFSKSNNLSVSPVIGIASKENVFQGVRLNYSTSKNEYSINNVSKSIGYGAGYFYRKYKTVFGKFSGFLQAGAGLDFSKHNVSGAFPSEANGLYMSISISPGITFPIFKHIYLESGFSNIAAVHYQKSKRTVPNSPGQNATSNSFGFSSSLSTAGSGLYFGFRIMLPK